MEVREIKFRGMTAMGNWAHGDLRHDREGKTNYYDDFPHRICWSEGNADLNVPVRKGSIGQFTGLHDKNGKEIYEGDIATWFINDITYTGPVYYDTDQASFWIGEDVEKRCGLVLNDWMRGEYEVIGNVWENANIIESTESA